MKSKYPFFIACLLGIMAFTCHTQPKSRPHISDQITMPTTDAHIVSKRQLFEAMREKREVYIVYGSHNKAFSSSYLDFAKALKKNARRTSFFIKKDTEINETDLKEKILFLIGTPNSNQVLKQLSNQLPIQFSDNNLTFGHKVYNSPNAVLSLSYYPNPLQPNLPINIVTGNKDEAIAKLLKQDNNNRRWLGWSSWDYELYDNNNRIMLGFLADTTWQMDKKIHFDFSGLGDTIVQSNHFIFISKNAGIAKQEAQQLAKNCENVIQKILAFTGSKKAIPKMTYYIYHSAEEKGLMIANTEHSNIKRTANEVHTVFNETYLNNYIGKEHELILNHLLGKPRHQALENGLAIYFTQTWQKKGYAYWAAKLFQSNNMIPLADILDNGLHQKGSDLMMGCLSAAFVEFLIQHWGKTDFLKRYKTWQANPEEQIDLEKKWHLYLAQTVHQFDFSNKNKPELPYLKGFNFAHEGYRIYNGYISQKATEAIKKMSTLGCNATAIVPYSFMRNPHQPSYIPFANSAGGENDESVIHSAMQAKKSGMSVLLKPQIWLGGGHWPGSIDMKNEADWNLFFQHYYRWMIHYAMLAEIHDIESFCLGVEMVKTSLNHEQAWRKMIQQVRGLYSGQITYAANWGEEFEQINFWEELDFIGLNSYYPLSKKDDASTEELEQGFQTVLQKIKQIYEKTHRPIVFTEIGFRSAPRPWKNPHAEGETNAYHGEHQAQCYEVIFKGIQNEPWCNGILWWKYPSYLEYQGLENTSFTPNRKPAEQVVKRWFLKESK